MPRPRPRDDPDEFHGSDEITERTRIPLSSTARILGWVMGVSLTAGLTVTAEIVRVETRLARIELQLEQLLKQPPRGIP